MSLVSEYRNIQSRVILSFSRMSCWGSKSQTPWEQEDSQGSYRHKLADKRTLGFTLVPAPQLPFTERAKEGQEEGDMSRLMWSVG